MSLLRQLIAEVTETWHGMAEEAVSPTIMKVAMVLCLAAGIACAVWAWRIQTS